MGAQPDAEVAEAAGVSAAEVKEYRRAHGIAAFLKPPPETGRPAGGVLEVGRGAPPATASVVRVAKRRRPGDADAIVVRVVVPPPEPALILVAEGEPAGRKTEGERPARPRPDRPLDRRPGGPARPVPRARPTRPDPLAPFLADLGRVSDSVVAARAGVSRELVGKYRRDRGIAGYTGHWHRGEDPTDSAPLADGRVQPPASPASLAPPAPAAPASSARSTAAASPRAVPTAEPGVLAPPLGGAAGSAAIDASPTGRRPSRLDAFRHLVGVLSDAQVARVAGVTPAGVQLYRRRRGIAPRSVAPTPPALFPELAVPSVSAPSAAETRAGSGRASARPAGASPVPATTSSANPVPATTPSAHPVPAIPPSAGPAATALPPSSAPSVPAATAAPAPAAPSTTAPATADRAFALRLAAGDAERRVYLVATDIGSAAALAVDRAATLPGGPWTVRSIRDLGETL